MCVCVSACVFACKLGTLKGWKRAPAPLEMEP